MKWKLLLPAALCALVLAACAGSPAAGTPAPTQTPTPTEAPAPAQTPDPLGTADLDALLSGLNLSGADLTHCTDDGEVGSYPADAAICAADYVEELRGYVWENYEPSPAEREKDSGYRYQLSAPGLTLTSFQSSRALRAVTGRGEGWFILPYREDGQVDWMTYDAFDIWYQEAEAATRYRGEGTPLTAEELAWFRDYTASIQNYYDEAGEYQFTGSTPISCFFTSQYSDPREMDAGEFLYYCPSQGNLGAEDEAEFQLVQAKLDWRSGEDGHLASITELPVPCHRLPRTYVNEILTRYAGITVEEMRMDWLEELLYIPETDCFYGFASDFGPGAFEVRYGEKSGDTVTLWEAAGAYGEAADVLTLQKAGDGWHILSHQAAAP